MQINDTNNLESTSFGGGRINKTTAGYDINYFIIDHLGSTRVILDNSGNIKEQKDFYAFGMEHQNPNLMTSTNRWGFSGKEKQTTGDLGYLDFTNRMYDDFLGRWFVQDPLAEKYYSWNSYNYCLNSPLKYADTDGKQAKIRTTPEDARSFTKTVHAIGRLLERSGWNSDIRTVGYYLQYPAYAKSVGEYKAGSNNISTIASNFELNIVNTSGLTSGQGSHGNAIRHTLWQSIITKEFGSEHAARIGNVHEDNPNTNLDKREFTTMEDADQTVDLLNNEIGRSIAQQNESANNKELTIAVITEYRDNGLWMVFGNKKDGYTIQRTKINNEQYEAAIREIYRKNEKGLNK